MNELENEKKRVQQYLAIAREIISNRSKDYTLAEEIEIAKMVQMAHRWGVTAKTPQKKPSPVQTDVLQIPKKAVVPTKAKRIYVDGGCSGNGTANQKAKIAITTDEAVIHEQPIGNYTSNEAEFYALMGALRIIQQSEKNTRKIVICSDSKLATKMVNGEWKGKKQELKKLALDCQKEWSGLKNVDIIWLPRKSNFAGIYLEHGNFIKK